MPYAAPEPTNAPHTPPLNPYGSTTSSSARLILSPARRHEAIHYGDPSGLSASSADTIAYPINYDELYNLKGRLLTLVDATFTDPGQRKAHKDLVWQTLRDWMHGIELAAQDPHGEVDG